MGSFTSLFLIYHDWSYFDDFKTFDDFWDLINYETFDGPEPRLFMRIWIIWFSAAIKLNILWRINYCLICFKDECDTPFLKYSDLCVYSTKFLCREIGVCYTLILDLKILIQISLLFFYTFELTVFSTALQKRILLYYLQFYIFSSILFQFFA